MDLELTEEQLLLQKSVREFAESEVRPLAKELDETGHFPRELFNRAAAGPDRRAAVAGRPHSVTLSKVSGGDRLVK